MAAEIVCRGLGHSKARARNKTKKKPIIQLATELFNLSLSSYKYVKENINVK